jgi:hypothetical protein
MQVVMSTILSADDDLYPPGSHDADLWVQGVQSQLRVASSARSTVMSPLIRIHDGQVLATELVNR